MYMRYVAEVRFIGSIYPGELPVLTRFYGPSISPTGQGAKRRTDYRLEPVPRGGKPFLLAVHDSFEEVLDVMALSSLRGTPQKKMQSKPVDVDTIKTDLLNEWTGRLANVPNGAMPGVGEVHLLDKAVAEYQRTGLLPDMILNSKTSGIGEAEYQQLLAQQTSFFEYWFGQGEKLYDQKKFEEVSPIMRLAADWLGHKRPWTNKDYVVESESCPFCTALVPKTAYICMTCGKTIRELPADLAALNRLSQDRPRQTA
jgi:hypothetical protein